MAKRGGFPGGMPGNMNNIMKQAQKMQKQMEQAQADLPYKAFPTSAGVVERRYCTQSGLLAGAGCPSTAVGYYRADDLPDTCTYSHAAPQAAAPAENTDDAVPTQPVIPTDTSALDTE